MLCLLDNTKNCLQISPTRDNLRFGEVDFGEPPVRQETVAPSFAPLLPSGAVVGPLQNTSTCLPYIPDPVSESACRESDVPIDESSVAPGSMQTPPRELTRSQSELGRSFLENADPANVRRRKDGKRTNIPPVPFALSDNVDSVSVPESLNEAGLREALEPSEGGTKKRRVESFGEWVDLYQRERSSIAWMTNVSDEREIFETLLILWNLQGLSVEIHRVAVQRDCQMGNRAKLPITVSCPVNSWSSMKQ